MDTSHISQTTAQPTTATQTRLTSCKELAGANEYLIPPRGSSAAKLRVKCSDLNIAFFYKQSAAYRTEMGIELDGEIVRKFPVPRLRTPQDKGGGNG
jgi:hypothetical protein